MGLLLLPIFIVFVLVVSSVGLLVGIKVGRWRHSSFWGIGAFFLVWAAVLGPEFFVHAQLRYLCKTQGGVRIYEAISEPKSLFIKDDNSISGNYNNRWQNSANAYLNDGYDSIENRSDKGDLYHFWHGKDGLVRRSKIIYPTSHYEWGYQMSIFRNKYIWVNTQTIRNRDTGKIVATYKNFGMAGGPLLQPILSKIGAGTGSYCDDYHRNLEAIYSKPTNFIHQRDN